MVVTAGDTVADMEWVEEAVVMAEVTVDTPWVVATAEDMAVVMVAMVVTVWVVMVVDTAAVTEWKVMVATKTWAATASIRSDDRVACIVLPSPCTIFIIFHFVRVLVAKRIIISKSIKCNRLSFVLFVFPKLFFSSQESKRNHFFFIHRILTRRTCTFIEFATF